MTRIIALFLYSCLVSFLTAQASIDIPERSKKEERKAQQLERLNQTDSYFVIELLGTHSNVQDQATSNQIYGGFGGGIGLGSFRTRLKNIHEYRMQGGYNLLRSQAGLSSNDFWGDFSYAYLRQISDSPNYTFALGGQANFLSQVRYTPSLGNSGLHWELLGSLGIVARYQRNFTLPWIRKNIQTFAQVHLPLVAYVNRPIYGITIDGMVQQFISPIGRFRRTDMEFGLFLPVRKEKNNPNQFRISYEWDIFRWRDNEVQRVITGQHCLSIALLVKMI